MGPVQAVPYSVKLIHVIFTKLELYNNLVAYNNIDDNHQKNESRNN